MLSNQKLQNTLYEIREASGLETALYGARAKPVASDGIALTEELEHRVEEFIRSAEESDDTKPERLYRVELEGETEYVLVCRVTDQMQQVCAQMALCHIRGLAASYAEQFDRNSFIQNILLGNMLVVDIFGKARKYHIAEVPRVVYLIDTGNKANDVVMELVRNLADTRRGDFVTSVDQHSVVLVKDVSSLQEERLDEELEEIAGRLLDSLHAEAMVRVRIAYGNVVGKLPEIAESYQEARLALEVGRVFYADRDTISYGRLGIGRLIYQLPMSLCEMFIKEVFGDKIPDIIDDEESMLTINKFFENNLNISETARQLYVHRNTLVYRLERIEKAIGLDIRTFDDAMTFRIAVMVIAHMKHV